MFKHSVLLRSVMNHAQQQPYKVAIILNGQQITYSQLWEYILSAALYLKELGVKPYDRIVLSADKSLEYISVYLASHVVGCVNVLVDSKSTAERLEYIVSRTQPTLCFGCDVGDYASHPYADVDLNHTPFPIDAVPQLQETDIAEILFTTGTTAQPKGCCLSYANICASASNINQYIQNTSEDVELLALPLCHSFGMGRLRCNLMSGATVVVLPSFADVRLFIKSFEVYPITGFAVVPSAWAYIRRVSGKRIGRYADCIRYVEIGSSSMPLETKEEMAQLFPQTRLCMHYGLTEASRSCFIELHDVAHRTSVGRAVCDQVDIRIYDAEGNCLPNGECGEICVKGNMVMTQYLNADHTQQAFFGEYFRTGDLGYISQGYVYLVGREKEIINVGGKKVSPSEVEDAIIALGVGDCVCVAMPDPKGILGELVKCYIKSGSTALTFAEIAQKLNGQIESYKQPVAYEWIDQIPMTESGKKQRIKLKG